MSRATDRIVLEGLEFHGYHGVYPEEAALGARFVVDVEFELPVSGRDELTATVDYGEVYALVRERVTDRRFQLIEALAVSIAEGVLDHDPRIERTVVRVHKPHAPLPGVLRDVFVEVVRARASASPSESRPRAAR